MSDRYETALGMYATTRGMTLQCATQLSRPMRDWPCIIERGMIALGVLGIITGAIDGDGSAVFSGVVLVASVWLGFLNPLWRWLGW